MLVAEEPESPKEDPEGEPELLLRGVEETETITVIFDANGGYFNGDTALSSEEHSIEKGEAINYSPWPSHQDIHTAFSEWNTKAVAAAFSLLLYSCNKFIIPSVKGISRIPASVFGKPMTIPLMEV